jgi:glycosyltransferase involved in cell wall biosynthesis
LPLFGFFCKDQAEAIASQGATVGVVAPTIVPSNTFKKWRFKKFGFHKKKMNGVTSFLCVIPSIPKFPRIRRWVSYFIGRAMLKSYVKSHGRPDIIHLQVYLAGDLALYASKTFNIPLVWTEHLSSVAKAQYSASERKLLLKLASMAKVRIGVSNFFCAELERQFNVPFQFIPNVYQSAIFYFKPNVSQPTAFFSYVNVSTFSKAKNLHRLINAFVFLQDLPDVKLILVGTGAYFDEIKVLVKAKGLDDKVVFAGALSPTDVAAQLHQAHVYVLSSDIETFNVSIVEAMACGLPVVSTKCGGPESIIVQDGLGLLVERDFLALAAGMRKLYTDYRLYDRQQISLHINKTYSYDVIGRRLVDTYNLTK